MKKRIFDECGIFRPTTERLLIFLLLAVIWFFIPPIQNQLLLNNRGTSFGTVLSVIGFVGNSILLVASVIGVYALGCMILYYLFRK